MEKKLKSTSYAKWGYIFIAPFFITFFIFSCIPLVDTIRFSFYEYFRSGLKVVGPNWVGIKNYVDIFNGNFGKYMWNTFVMWGLGFVPQIVIALILAAWFTDNRLKLRGKTFFKIVIYLPNLIMASAFSMLFFTLFSPAGPINGTLQNLGIIAKDSPIRFFETTVGTRGIVALMNFLMWFGNTTIMLMAAIAGVNPSLFEAASLDGCDNTQTFFRITLPLIRPVLTYTMITSLIGGLQMFDVPQILTNGKGQPNETTMTLIMLLNSHLKSKNYGAAGALSVYLFIISGILCFFVYRSMNSSKEKKGGKR